MSFNDLPLKAGPSGLDVSGLGLSKTGAMTLEVAPGSVGKHRDGSVATLGSAQSYAFNADPSNPTEVFMGLVDNGVAADLWVDAYVVDGKTVRADPPNGYNLVLELAWFSIPAGETDLNNVQINRRVWE